MMRNLDHQHIVIFKTIRLDEISSSGVGGKG